MAAVEARERGGAQRIAFVSILWAAVVAATKLTVGVLSGSVAILGDGLHSAIDVGATTLTFGAVRLAARPPDREHPYGHGRAENLAALAEAFLMAGVAVYISYEAASRLVAGHTLEFPDYVIPVMVGAIVVDAARAVVLRRAARRYSSPALAADAMNFTADIGESIAVLAGLVAVRLGFPAGDPIAAVVLAAGMVVMAGRVGASAVDVLMDRHPEPLAERIGVAALSVPGVLDLSDVRVRTSGADVHTEVVVSIGRTSSVERSHDITEAIEEAIARAVPGASTTVHVEPSPEGEDVVERTFAAANRVGMADQVHNVLAVRHPEGVWLMLHAKVPPLTPLSTAHAVTDQLEAEIRSEIADVARVEIHIEPREPRALQGVVVSAERADLIDDVRRIAEAHAPITRCHEVAATQTADGLHLVVHCEAPPDTPIAAIHDASLGLETDVHERHREVRTITVHFEPEDT